MDLGIHCNVSSEWNNHHPKNKTVLKYLYLVGGEIISGWRKWTHDGAASFTVNEIVIHILLKQLHDAVLFQLLIISFSSLSTGMSSTYCISTHTHRHTRPLVVMFTVWLSRQTALLHFSLGKLCFSGATFSHCLQGCSGPTVFVSCTDSFFFLPLMSVVLSYCRK